MEHCQLQPQHSDFLEYTLKTFVMGDEYNGPIGIVKAVLNQNGKEKNVYIVALSGTELIWSDYTGLQSTGAVTDLLCGFNLDNPYIKAVVKAMKQNIPAGSDVVFYGHSLGGMIATGKQQRTRRSRECTM